MKIKLEKTDIENSNYILWNELQVRVSLEKRRDYQGDYKCLCLLIKPNYGDLPIYADDYLNIEFKQKEISKKEKRKNKFLESCGADLDSNIIDLSFIENTIKEFKNRQSLIKRIMKESNFPKDKKSYYLYLKETFKNKEFDLWELGVHIKAEDKMIYTRDPFLLGSYSGVFYSEEGKKAKGEITKFSYAETLNQIQRWLGDEVSVESLRFLMAEDNEICPVLK